MFERIIVPLDGSRLSAQAIPYAAEVGKRFDAEVILVRVLPQAGLSFLHRALSQKMPWQPISSLRKLG